jgi:hypothetical protein
MWQVCSCLLSLACHRLGGTDVVEIPDYVFLPAEEYLNMFDSESDSIFWRSEP